MIYKNNFGLAITHIHAQQIYPISSFKHTFVFKSSFSKLFVGRVSPPARQVCLDGNSKVTSPDESLPRQTAFGRAVLRVRNKATLKGCPYSPEQIRGPRVWKPALHIVIVSHGE